MEDAPLPNMSITPKEPISEKIDIITEDKAYKLIIEIGEITMKIKIENEDPFIGTYSRFFSIREIKELHPVFNMLNSFNEFVIFDISDTIIVLLGATELALYLLDL